MTHCSLSRRNVGDFLVPSDNALMSPADSTDSPAAAPLTLDLVKNRAARKYSPQTQALRVLWSFGCWALRLSPRPMFGWRRWVLRAFGAKVGRHVHVYPTAKIYMPWNVEIGDWAAIGEDALLYSLGRITIGPEVTISHRAHICAGSHDLNDPALPLIKPPIVLRAKAWICTDAFIGPGVTIGEGAVVGARAVVMRDVPAAQIVAGNPARPIGERTRASS